MGKYTFTDRGNMVGKKPRATYWTELQDAVNDLDDNKVDNSVLNAVDNKIGVLSNLLTTAKTSIVNAVNELFNKIGNLVSLKTNNNTDLVSAINEVHDEVKSHLAENVTEDNVHGLRSANVVLGEGSSAVNTGTGNTQAVVIGKNAQVQYSNFADRGSIAIGNEAKAIGDFFQISIGENARSEKQSSISVGTNSIARGSGGISIGRGADCVSGVALGDGAVSENTREGVLGSVTYGKGPNAWLVPGAFTVNGTKNFEIPHPKPEKKATHRIRHGAVESPTPGDTLYRYKVHSEKENDIQHIDLPDYFIYLNKDVQIFVTPQGHFGNGYGVLNKETEQLEIHCQYEGEYNVLVIGTRNDDHQSVQDWSIKGVEREIGESWTGETYVFSVEEVIEVEEIKEEVA